MLALIKFIDGLPKDSGTQIMANQLLRSGTSVGANYIEAQAGSSKRDFANFLNHALKSANESKFWIMLLRDAKEVDENDAEKLLSELEEISKILASSILTTKGKL